MRTCNVFAKFSKKILNVIRCCINLDTLSLKKLDKNEEFEFDLIVAKNNVASSEKIL